MDEITKNIQEYTLHNITARNKIFSLLQSLNALKWSLNPATKVSREIVRHTTGD